MSKLSDFFSKQMGNRISRSKLQNALKMVEEGDTQKLLDKLNSLDQKQLDELTNKIMEFDSLELEKMAINKEQLREKLASMNIDQLLNSEAAEKIKKLLQ